MAKRKAPAKVRGVYEKVPGSGIWWIQYKQGTIRKREKAGCCLAFREFDQPCLKTHPDEDFV